MGVPWCALRSTLLDFTHLIKTNTWAKLLQVGRQNGYIYSAEHDGWSDIAMLVLFLQHHNQCFWRTKKNKNPYSGVAVVAEWVQRRIDQVCDLYVTVLSYICARSSFLFSFVFQFSVTVWLGLCNVSSVRKNQFYHVCPLSHNNARTKMRLVSCDDLPGAHTT